MMDWWRTAIFYEVYLRSFYDSNGDGIGDFPGLTSKLDYLKELGVDALWLTPFYVSPNVDYGYDIADYYQIDPAYGSMEDFAVFLEEAHARGIKVIADLVLNHTSSTHPWFIEAQSSRAADKRDWYIWHDSVDDGEPNNWESGFEGAAWSYDGRTTQYYYHAFAKEQVDLNWANPEVHREMFEVVRFWLARGLDGFRLDVINHLVVDKELRDNPVIGGKQQHLYDKDREETHDIVKNLRKLADSYGKVVLVGEVATEDIEIAKSYLGQAQELDLTFNFNLGSIPEFDLDRIFMELVRLEGRLGAEELPTLFFSSHDMSRHINRLGTGLAETEQEDRGKVLAALILTARGVPFLYYGEEIGMRDIYITEGEGLRDVAGQLPYHRALEEGLSLTEALQLGNQKGRDKGRSPMQWDSSGYAGFSSVEPWLAVNSNHRQLNVADQAKNENSILNHYRELMRLRHVHSALHSGSYEILQKSGDLLYYLRQTADERILVLLNFALEFHNVNMDELGIHDEGLFLFSNKRTALRQGKWFAMYPNEVLIMLLTKVEEQE